jgi:hypothetical protein
MPAIVSTLGILCLVLEIAMATGIGTALAKARAVGRRVKRPVLPRFRKIGAVPAVSKPVLI